MITKSRLALNMAIVGAMLVLVSGCAEKEAEQAEAMDSGDMQTEMTTDVATGPAGTYWAEIAPAEGDGSKVTLVLNQDNSAMMVVDFESDQPNVTQSGTWEMGDAENVVNFNYGGEGSMMTVQFSMMGEELHMMESEATGFGVDEITLKKVAAENDPHAGHSHEDGHEGHSH
jgi:hypothetical protein